MVKHTKKPQRKLRNKTSKIGVIKGTGTGIGTTEKRCYNDSQMGEVCSTGQFSMYKGNFYKNKNNIEKFKRVRDEFRKNPKYKTFKTYKEKYNAFLKK